MKILAVGGGSGGHVTPVVAVFKELRNIFPDAEMRFWCDKKFANQAKDIMCSFDSRMKISVIISGKLRRYHHLSFLEHLLIPSVVFPNIVDAFKVIGGTIQACFKLVVWRPDVIFAKGGYVCLPVGFGARILGIPLVIHDSDAHPGLTNRLLAPHAKYIATGAPLENYPYDRSRSKYVGIPIASDFKQVSAEEASAIKDSLGFNSKLPLVVVTGGGLGAKRINDAIIKEVDKITTKSSLLLISGVGQYDDIRKKVGDDTERFKLVPFVSEGMHKILASADVVVARAGATTIFELAAVGAPTILVPNARLTGGHQVKNASVYAKGGAVELADEDKFKDDSTILSNKIISLLSNELIRKDLSIKIHKFAKPMAAKDMASLIAKAVKP